MPTILVVWGIQFVSLLIAKAVSTSTKIDKAAGKHNVCNEWGKLAHITVLNTRIM